MALPKAVKIKRDGVEFTNNTDLINYTVRELVRAALRDCGKLFCNRFKQAYYARFKRKSGRVGRFTQYWVRAKQEVPDLLVGIKPNGFYGGMQEFGSSKTPRLGLMTKTAQDNIDEFKKIQEHYLGHLNDKEISAGLLNDKEYKSDGFGKTTGSSKSKKNKSIIKQSTSTVKSIKNKINSTKNKINSIKNMNMQSIGKKIQSKCAIKMPSVPKTTVKTVAKASKKTYKAVKNRLK